MVLKLGEQETTVFQQSLINRSHFGIETLKNDYQRLLNAKLIVAILVLKQSYLLSCPLKLVQLIVAILVLKHPKWMLYI